MNKGERHGAGTCVNADASERYEGLWVQDHFCAGKGQKEYCDGTVQFGKFVHGVWQGEVSISSNEESLKSSQIGVDKTGSGSEGSGDGKAKRDVEAPVSSNGIKRETRPNLDEKEVRRNEDDKVLEA